MWLTDSPICQYFRQTRPPPSVTEGFLYFYDYELKMQKLNLIFVTGEFYPKVTKVHD
jgi:hypothetical protein